MKVNMILEELNCTQIVKQGICKVQTLACILWYIVANTITSIMATTCAILFCGIVYKFKSPSNVHYFVLHTL